jgi:hypothetical protein
VALAKYRLERASDELKHAEDGLNNDLHEGEACASTSASHDAKAQKRRGAFVRADVCAPRAR